MWLCKKKTRIECDYVKKKTRIECDYVIIKWGGINAFNLTQLI